MYYSLFINKYDSKISNIVLLEKNYTLLQTKNILIFLFDSFKFDGLLERNKVIIVMSFEKLDNYYEMLKDNTFIVPFIRDKNSMNFIEKSLFGDRVSEKKYVINYKLLLDFLKYMSNNNYKEFIVISGVVYMLYGLRTNRDIDIITSKNYKTKFTKMKIDSHYLKSNNEYIYLFKDPSYTFYFKGARISTLETDLNILRSWRVTDPNFQYPRAVANMVMVKKLVNPNLKIPIDLLKLDQNKQKRVLKHIKRHYRSNYSPFENLT